tara:strand:+ start:128 stop:460 length:333 start_codon:yes stop_codon:yes gene_type:complete
MSSYQKTRVEKRKTKSMMLQVENDIPTEEFDHYYQKCLENKKRRLQAKQLKTETTVEEEVAHQPTATHTLTNEKYFGEGEGYIDDEEYEEMFSNEEIDRAFEEAERWSDF